MNSEGAEGQVIELNPGEYTVNKPDLTITEKNEGEKRNRQVTRAILQFHDPNTDEKKRRKISLNLQEEKVDKNWLNPDNHNEQAMINMFTESVPKLQDLCQKEIPTDLPEKAKQLIKQAESYLGDLIAFVNFNHSPNTCNESEGVYNSRYILEVNKTANEIKKRAEEIARREKQEAETSELLGAVFNQILKKL